MDESLTGPDLVYEAPHEDLADVALVDLSTDAFAPNAPRARTRATKPLDVTFLDEGLYGPLEAYRVKTALVRSELYRDAAPVQIKGPRDLAYLIRHMALLDQEHVVVVAVNTGLRVLAIHEAFIGGTASAQIEVAHALKVAFLTSAHAIFMAHNHPSGDPSPSDADKMVFEHIKHNASCAGIIFMDSLVVARDGWSSIEDGGYARPWV